MNAPLKTNNLIIDNLSIRVDAEGRFCLNDIHKAAGGKDKDKPANWLRLEQSQELIAELTSSHIRAPKQNQSFANSLTEIFPFHPVNVVNGGSAPGTYVAKELVYAYAGLQSLYFAF
jgi:hypothetical protein